MTIRNLTAFIGALWDWACLDGCFPRGISPTDIDALVEIKGRFLLIEAKGDGKSVPVGQRYTFDGVVDDDRWTVVIVWGEPQAPVRMAVWPGESFPASLDALRRVVKAWSDWADRRPPKGERFAWPPVRAAPRCDAGCRCAVCIAWPME